jgi:hypothetical protein
MSLDERVQEIAEREWTESVDSGRLAADYDAEIRHAVGDAPNEKPSPLGTGQAVESEISARAANLREYLLALREVRRLLALHALAVKTTRDPDAGTYGTPASWEVDRLGGSGEGSVRQALARVDKARQAVSTDDVVTLRFYLAMRDRQGG